MKKKIIFIVFLLLFFVGIKVNAYDICKNDKIYVSGEPIGIKLNTGVEVVGTFGIKNNSKVEKPWEQSGIREKDKIIELNNTPIDNIKGLLEVLRKTKGEEVQIKYIRNNKEYVGNIKPSLDNDSYSLGLYVKDCILGVGTLTYYLEGANVYGSLGHQIDTDSFTEGMIYEAKVTGIVLPTRNKAGEKQAQINNTIIGSVEKNTETGIHGIASSKIDISNMEYLNFKTRDEINLGKAEIWTAISGDEVEKFEIEIISLEKQNQKDIKGISFKVIDERLINKTGGIIQGMSGSPIVQDNKLIGAVTHVSIKDATIAYGIYLEWMLEDMDIHVIK